MENNNPEGNLFLDDILRNISDGFIYLDQNWTYRMANDTVLALMNRKKEDLIGKTIWDVFPELTGTIFEKNYRKVMDNSERVSFEAFHPLFGNWIEVRAYPHTSGISIFYTDIAEKKKAREIVNSSEQWFRNIAQNSPVMIWSANTNKDFNYVNQAWLRFGGRTEQHELGLGWLAAIYKEDRNRVLELYCYTFDSRVEFRTEYRLLYHNGSYRWVSHAGRPMYAPDKTFVGYAGTCIDIDEQVMVYRELENMVMERTAELTAVLEREKELNNQKSRFVSIASHEFRTPLSTMLSSLGLIEQYLEINDSAQVKKHVGRIKGSTKHMISILNDFLSLDKLQQGSVKVEASFFELNSCLEETIEELQPMLNPGQAILCNYSGDRVICSDKKIIHNIMLNLLSNAIKYSDKDIQLKVLVTSTEINIAITDQGIGIPKAEQESLFNKYFRASNVGNVKGTGLGLNIVQRYIELLGGSIHFESEPGIKTVFEVQLPNIQFSEAERQDTLQ